MDGMTAPHAAAATMAKRVFLLTLVIGCVMLSSDLLNDVRSRRGGEVNSDRRYSFRGILSPAADDFESFGAESPYALPPRATCDEVVNSVFGRPSLSEPDSQDGKVNALRRMLAMERPSCYERHLRLFADHFLRRLETVRRHLTLNIPEAGGTSLCRAARRSGFGTFPRERECWESPHLWSSLPFRSQGTFKDPWTVFQDYRECMFADLSLPEFVINQNYVNLPLCTKQRIYSLTLRDVADRVTSQEGRLASLTEKHKAEMTPEEYLDWRRSSSYEDRLSLLQNNYVTWSLTASLHRGGPLSPPEERRLVDAKRALMKFDFLLEEARDGAPYSGCNAAVLRLMGFNDTEILPEGTAEAGPDRMEAAASREAVEERNGLDVKLIEFGRRLLDVDCAFFERVASLGGNSALMLPSESHPASAAA